MTEEFTSYEEPKATEGEVDLPRGYVVTKKGETYRFYRATLRELTGEEEDIIENDSLGFSRRMVRIVGNCLVSLADDKGNEITDTKTLQEAAMNFTIGDITACMFELRCLTTGSEFKQRVRCLNPNCDRGDGKPLEWTARFDIRKDFPIVACTDPDLVVREFVTKKGTRITWQFATARSRVQFETNRTKTNKSTAALLMRVMTVNGEPASEEILKKMTKSEREEIRDHMIPLEGGIDTTFDVDCKECGYHFKDILLVRGFDFFYHSATSED